MLYLTCTTISRVGLAQYGVSHAKDWVCVDCGTINNNLIIILQLEQFVFFQCSFVSKIQMKWQII